MNLTFVLPTYNRSQNLIKLYRFYKKKKIDKNLIIIDGSLKKNFHLIKKKNYFHKPNLNRQERIIFGLKRVRTEFVCIAADDDLYICENIKQIIKNMIKTSSEIGRGITYNFYLDKKKIKLKKKPATTKNLDKGAFTNLQIFIKEKNIFFSQCIFKTSFFKKIFEKLKGFSFLEFEINHELFITLYSLIFGKVSYTDKVYNLRQQSNYKVGLDILYNYPFFVRIKNFFKIFFLIVRIYPPKSKINLFSLLEICNLKFDFFPRRQHIRGNLSMNFKKKKSKTENYKNLKEYKMLKKFYKV